MLTGASASPTTTAYPSVFAGVPLASSALPVESPRPMANAVRPPIRSSTATTAPTIRNWRRRSARSCSRRAAAARSAVDGGRSFGMVGPLGCGGRASEEQRVEGEAGARLPDQPQGQQQEADVAGDLPRVFRGRVGVEAAAAEAAAVDLEAARPGRGDADDEG